MTFALDLTRGDDRTLTVTLNDTDGDPYDWTGAKLWFTAKTATDQSDDDAPILKTSPSGGITFPTPGKATVVIDKDDTAGLPNRSTRLLCDVQLLTAAGKIHTVDEGSITVGYEITLATS